MKHFSFSFLLVVACGVVLYGCSDKAGPRNQLTPPEEMESMVSSLPDYHYYDSVQMGAHLYTYDVLRQATDSLPHVTDEMGDEARDNTIRLLLTRDGRTYFGHTFTKQTFQSSLDEEFYKRSILDGIRFIGAEAGKGITFIFAVSEPNSDMTVPFSLTVADDGSFSFVKTEMMDMEE